MHYMRDIFVIGLDGRARRGDVVLCEVADSDRFSSRIFHVAVVLDPRSVLVLAPSAALPPEDSSWRWSGAVATPTRTFVLEGRAVRASRRAAFGAPW